MVDVGPGTSLPAGTAVGSPGSLVGRLFPILGAGIGISATFFLFAGARRRRDASGEEDRAGDEGADARALDLDVQVAPLDRAHAGGRGSARRGGSSSDAARRASTMRSTAGAARAQTSRLPRTPCAPRVATSACAEVIPRGGARSRTAPLLGRDGEAEVPAGVDVVALGHVERLAADRTPIRRSPISSRADHGWQGGSPLSREGSRAGATPSSRGTPTPQIVSLSDNLEDPCHGSVARSVDCSSFLWLRSIC